MALFKANTINGNTHKAGQKIVKRERKNFFLYACVSVWKDDQSAEAENVLFSSLKPQDTH